MTAKKEKQWDVEFATGIVAWKTTVTATSEEAARQLAIKIVNMRLTVMEKAAKESDENPIEVDDVALAITNARLNVGYRVGEHDIVHVTESTEVDDEQ